jgi:hypothetical protein
MENHYAEGYVVQIGQFTICLGFQSENLKKPQAKKLDGWKYNIYLVLFGVSELRI